MVDDGKVHVVTFGGIASTWKEKGEESEWPMLSETAVIALGTYMALILGNTVVPFLYFSDFDPMKRLPKGSTGWKLSEEDSGPKSPKSPLTVTAGDSIQRVMFMLDRAFPLCF